MTDPMHYPYEVETIRMNDHVAGLDLDTKIAEIVDAHPSVSEHEGYRACVANWTDGRGRTIFRPSTHWADAMEAAERFAPFLKKLVLFPAVDQATPGGPVVWCVSPITSNNELGDSIVTSRSGPMAICLAILKLSK